MLIKMMQEKKWSGEITREECDKENACKFLLLLKINNYAQIDNNKEISTQ